VQQQQFSERQENHATRCMAIYFMAIYFMPNAGFLTTEINEKEDGIILSFRVFLD